MQCLRRILRISRREHVTTAQNLVRAKLDTKHDMIRHGRLRCLGHLARQEAHQVAKEDLA